MQNDHTCSLSLSVYLSVSLSIFCGVSGEVKGVGLYAGGLEISKKRFEYLEIMVKG